MTVVANQSAIVGGATEHCTLRNHSVAEVGHGGLTSSSTAAIGINSLFRSHERHAGRHSQRALIATKRTIVFEALPLLQAAVAEDPQSLHGAAHALMAETYYALPDIAGGDLDLAIDMMRAALQRDPDNPLYARLLAGYLLDTAQDGEARSILNQILQMQADAGGLQLRADQLQAASDLATRIGDAVLAQQLSAQREKMYEDYPYLQKRSVVSAIGHFGDKDPMEDPG